MAEVPRAFRALSCEKCKAPLVLVGGEVKKTYVTDVVLASETEVRGMRIPTVTVHSSLCPDAHRARSN